MSKAFHVATHRRREKSAESLPVSLLHSCIAWAPSTAPGGHGGGGEQDSHTHNTRKGERLTETSRVRLSGA